MLITKSHLPNNCYSSSKMKSIDGIVIHYFSGKYQFPSEPFNVINCFRLFNDLNRPANERQWFKMQDVPARMYASAHFMIARDGEILELVPLPHKAWHAGKSKWNGKSDCNSWMVGIEMIATDTSGFTTAQYDSLIELTNDLMSRYPNITWDNITGHENIAPGRKTDPGKHFDWDHYRAMKTSKSGSIISKIAEYIPWHEDTDES